MQAFFGSWDAALREAGLEAGPCNRRAKWTERRIVEALRADAEARGRPPTIDEWLRADRKRRRPTAQTVKAVFGSWSIGLAAAGLEAQKSGGELWTHCKQGHTLEGDNLGVNSRGKRFCRTCRRAWDREAKRRQRAERRAAYGGGSAR